MKEENKLNLGGWGSEPDVFPARFKWFPICEKESDYSAVYVSSDSLIFIYWLMSLLFPLSHSLTFLFWFIQKHAMKKISVKLQEDH